LSNELTCLSTDLHPDPFYKYHSSVAEGHACHSGKGPAGAFGAETTDCDSPFSLVNATFKWIDENIRDDIDFIIWTGDSARHDNDEKHPRNEEQITYLNRYTVSKFYEVFGRPDDDPDPTNDLLVPVVPTWGNNDVLPHNIFTQGPNKWTKEYLDIWRNFIPESQRHGFAEGGYFFTEVIPNKLAVFSLNSLYFFDSNSAVDGCADRKEPGYRQFEWLRIQLNFLRQRGMKAILIGHVPPARTDNKQSWDETCWQKYTLWMRQYRDVVVGSLWGHMNIDHFMLQDSNQINIDAMTGQDEVAINMREFLGDEITVEGAADYLTELRHKWSKLPTPPKDFSNKKRDGAKKAEKHPDYFQEIVDYMNELRHGWSQLPSPPKNLSNDVEAVAKRKKDKKLEKYLKEIGGEWGERYSLGLVSPSIVPNYFPTLRIIEYNISGIEDMTNVPPMADTEALRLDHSDDIEHRSGQDSDDAEVSKGHKSHKNKKKDKKHKFKSPKAPSKTAPPGPAYSPQTLTWLRYTQMFANLTVINNDFVSGESGAMASSGWKDGKHPDKEPKDNDKPHSREFKFELEYDTKNDSIYQMEDLTVRNWVKLAARIGKYKPKKGDKFKDSVEDCEEELDGSEASDDEKDAAAHSENKKHRGRKRRAKNKVWFTFIKRAFVSSMDDEDLHRNFGQKAIDKFESSPRWFDDARSRYSMRNRDKDIDDADHRNNEVDMEL
jgi:endopolyphosphatase